MIIDSVVDTLFFNFTGLVLFCDDVIVSFNRNRQTSKWSEMDIVYLAILGNIFGNGIYND